MCLLLQHVRFPSNYLVTRCLLDTEIRLLSLALNLCSALQLQNDKLVFPSSNEQGILPGEPVCKWSQIPHLRTPPLLLDFVGYSLQGQS